MENAGQFRDPRTGRFLPLRAVMAGDGQEEYLRQVPTPGQEAAHVLMVEADDPFFGFGHRAPGQGHLLDDQAVLFGMVTFRARTPMSCSSPRVKASSTLAGRTFSASRRLKYGGDEGIPPEFPVVESPLRISGKAADQGKTQGTFLTVWIRAVFTAWEMEVTLEGSR